MCKELDIEGRDEEVEDSDYDNDVDVCKGDDRVDGGKNELRGYLM